jgi:hypothetical protein
VTPTPPTGTTTPATAFAVVARRGAKVAGDALVTLMPATLELVVRREGCDPARVELSYDDMRELQREPDRVVTLEGARGDRVRLAFETAEESERFEGAILDRCCALPELTRALRSLGSRRSTTASAAEADRFFEPLLEARHRAARQPGFVAADAFDAAAIIRQLERTAGEFARERHPGRESARRALEARLLDHLDPLMAALVELRASAEVLREAEGAARLGGWREWVRRLRAVFDRADESWPHLAAELARAPASSRRLPGRSTPG